MLTNLSTNAMKFTDEGCIVLSVEPVELHPDDDYASPHNMHIPHLLFRVIDTGIGMNPDTVHSLFQRFYQGETSFARKVCVKLT